MMKNIKRLWNLLVHLIKQKRTYNGYMTKQKSSVRTKAIYNAVLDGIKIIDGKDKERTPEAIPSILSDALAVSFDLSVGHDYVEDGLNRYEFYHKERRKDTI